MQRFQSLNLDSDGSAFWKTFLDDRKLKSKLTQFLVFQYVTIFHLSRRLQDVLQDVFLKKTSCIHEKMFAGKR